MEGEEHDPAEHEAAPPKKPAGWGKGQPQPSHRGRHKCSRDEMIQRVEMTSMLIAQGRKKYFIKAALKQQFGVQSPRECERIIGLAKKLIVQSLGKPLEELRAESFAHYLQIIQTRDPEGSLPRDKAAFQRVRMAARERIDKLLGLEAPTKVARTNVAGEDLESVALEGMTTEELRVIASLQQRLAGEPVDQPALPAPELASES